MVKSRSSIPVNKVRRPMKNPESQHILYPSEGTIRNYQCGIVIDYQKAREELRQRRLVNR